MPLTRISMTIPASLVKAADRRARELRRSRSWLIVEALRRYLGFGFGSVDPGSGARDRGRVAAVREPLAAPYGAEEVAEARRRHLRAEMELPVSERLRRGWELGQLGRERQPRGRRAQIVAFETYEDYYEWKKGRLIGR